MLYYRAHEDVIAIHLRFWLLGNANGVNSYLMGDNSPMVNAIRLVFSELYVASVPATPLQQSRLLYYELDQLIVSTCVRSPG